MIDPHMLGGLSFWGLSAASGLALCEDDDRSWLGIAVDLAEMLSAWQGSPANHQVAKAVYIAHAQAIETVVEALQAEDKGGWSPYPIRERSFYGTMIKEAQTFHRRATALPPSTLAYHLREDLAAQVPNVLSAEFSDVRVRTKLLGIAPLNALGSLRDAVAKARLVEHPRFEPLFRETQPGRGYLAAFGAAITRQIKTNDDFRTLFCTQGLARASSLKIDAASVLTGFEACFGSAFEGHEAAEARRAQKYDALLFKIASAHEASPDDLRPLFEAVRQRYPDAVSAEVIETASAAFSARSRLPVADFEDTNVRDALVRSRQKLERLDSAGAVDLLRAAQEVRNDGRPGHARSVPALASEEAQILKMACRWDEAVPVFQRLVALDINNPTPFIEMGSLLILLNQVSMVLPLYQSAAQTLLQVDLGDPSPAKAERALGDGQRLIAKAPVFHLGFTLAPGLTSADLTVSELYLDLAARLDHVADLVQQGEGEEAEAANRASLALRERIARAFPNDVRAQHEVSRSFNRLGDDLIEQDRLEEALEAYRGALAVVERLASASPQSVWLQQSLRHIHGRIGKTFARDHRDDAASESCRRAIAISERLVRDNPTEPTLQREHFLDLNALADLLMTENRLTEAAEAYQAGLEIIERLARADPGNPQLDGDLSLSHGRMGNALEKQGRLAEAEASYRACHVIIEELARLNPRIADMQEDLVASYDALGSVLRKQDRLSEAAESYNSANAIRRRLLDGDPTDPQRRHMLAFGYSKIGDVLEAQGSIDDAVAAHRSGLELFEDLALDYPKKSMFRHSMVISHMRLGDLGVDPIENYRTGLAIARDLDAGGRLNERDRSIVADLEARLRVSERAVRPTPLYQRIARLWRRRRP